jgi:hypothetical protein
MKLCEHELIAAASHMAAVEPVHALRSLERVHRILRGFATALQCYLRIPM